MLLRLGLPALLIAAAPFGRGCIPATSSLDADEAAGSVGAVVAAEPPPAPEPTPAPPARASLTPASLAAGAPSELAAGEALGRALKALDEGRLDDVVALLPDAPQGLTADLARWTKARALRALDRGDEADPLLAGVDPDGRFGAEARLARAENAVDAGLPEVALSLLGPFDPAVPYGPLAARADTVRARALDRRQGPGDLAAAVQAALRVWRGDPGSQADADATILLDALEPSVGPDLRRGLPDRVARAASFGLRSGKKSIVDLIGADRPALVALAATDPATACTGLFELGRAFHKQREYSSSVPVLADADGVCAGDEQVKTLYLLAQGRARSGQVKDGIATFLRLPDEHPEHSYADDGLWQASRLSLDESDNAAAARLAQRLVDEFPDGDMRGATLWNLAWAAVSDQRPIDALPWLETMGKGDVLGPDREDVLQGRYWTARILLQTTPSRREEALDGLVALATEHPTHWYGTLAGWQLSKQDPARAIAAEASVRAAAATMRATSPEPAAFTPLQEFVDLPGVQTTLAYLRAGLGEEAAAELGRTLGTDANDRWDDADTLLFAAHLFESAGDPARSHNLLRRACSRAFPASSPETAATLMHAWPRAFSDVIATHTSTYGWDEMLFQGLVREESAFSPTVVSWAGAIGLSQLMWPTAKETARRMGIRVSRADLRDPSTNVRIGTTYFDGLATRWSGHLPLAVASYNAGPGAVKKWVDARGHLDLDAWVETIPYDQTRHYVKRVVSSWQVYRFLYGRDGGWVPLRVGPVAAAITEADPAPPAAGG